MNQSTPKTTQAQPAAAKPATNAELKNAIRNLDGMTPNATCSLYTGKGRLLMVAGPLDQKADFDAVCTAADKYIANQDMNTSMRAFADLRGTHLVIEAMSHTQPEED